MSNKNYKQDIQKSARPKNENASVSPVKKPEKSKLDDYTPPSRKKRN